MRCNLSRSLLVWLCLSFAVGCSSGSGSGVGGGSGGSAGGGAGGGSAGVGGGGTAVSGTLAFSPSFARSSYYKNFMDAGFNANYFEVVFSNLDLQPACNAFKDGGTQFVAGQKVISLQFQPPGSDPLTATTYDLSGASSLAYGIQGADGGFILYAAGTGGQMTLTSFSKQSATGTFDVSMINLQDGGTSTMVGKFEAPFCTTID